MLVRRARTKASRRCDAGHEASTREAGRGAAPYLAGAPARGSLRAGPSFAKYFPKYHALTQNACDHTLTFREILPLPYVLHDNFSATESDNSKNSSAATTPKNSTRKLAFSPSGDVGNSGYRYAHWEDHPHKKRREGRPEGDDAAGAGGGGGTTV